MATVEGGVGTLDSGAMLQEAASVLTSLAAALSEGVSAGGTVVETVADDGSKTIQQTRETLVGEVAVQSSTLILQPSTAEGSASGASAQLSSEGADAEFSASVPAGVVVAATGPDASVDASTAGALVASTIADTEVAGIVAAAAAASTGNNVVIKTVTPIPQDLASGQVTISAPARVEGEDSTGTRVIVIDTSSVRSNPNIELGLSNVEFVVLDAAANTVPGGLTADESAYGGAIRITEGSSEIIGTSQADLLYGGSTGSDRLTTGSGDDVVYTGSGGSSYVSGGAGADHVVGSLTSAGGNTVDGGLGNDVLVAGGAKTAATDTFLEANADIVSAIEDQRQFAGLRDLVDAEVSETSVELGDTFVFGSNSGYDYVFNYHVGVDAIQVAANVNGTGVASAADVLARATSVGSDTLIDLGGGNAIHLSGVALSSLSADDIVIG